MVPMRGVPFTLVMLGALYAASCAHGDYGAEWLPVAFADFTYVGQYTADRTKPIPHHGIHPQPLPRRLRSGIAYVFHTKEMLTTEDAALALLPRKLREAGVDILDGPKNSGEFAIPNSGGPRWSIRFRYGDCEGELYNAEDPALWGSRSSWPPGSRDDYVLVLHR